MRLRLGFRLEWILDGRKQNGAKDAFFCAIPPRQARGQTQGKLKSKSPQVREFRAALGPQSCPRAVGSSGQILSRALRRGVLNVVRAKLVGDQRCVFFDRAHRLGQHKPIRAVRFVVRNTVEERILRLQDKKRLVFEGTVGGDAASLSQLSEDDLRFLFQN